MKTPKQIAAECLGSAFGPGTEGVANKIADAIRAERKETMTRGQIIAEKMVSCKACECTGWHVLITGMDGKGVACQYQDEWSLAISNAGYLKMAIADAIDAERRAVAEECIRIVKFEADAHAIRLRFCMEVKP